MSEIFVVSDNEIWQESLENSGILSADLFSPNEISKVHVFEKLYEIALIDYSLVINEKVCLKTIRAKLPHVESLVFIGLIPVSDGVDARMLETAGFDDFIFMPFEKASLKRVIDRWSKENPPSVSFLVDNYIDPLELQKNPKSAKTISKLSEISDLNVRKALLLVNNSGSIYEDIVKIFIDSYEERMEQMKDYLFGGKIGFFEIGIHAIKSSLYSIGANDLGDQAKMLETAAKGSDIDYCKEKFSAFETKLYLLADQIKAVVPNTNNDVDRFVLGNSTSLKIGMEKVVEHLGNFESDEAFRIVKSFDNYKYSEEINTSLNSLRSTLQNFIFNEAVRDARDILSLIK